MKVTACAYSYVNEKICLYMIPMWVQISNDNYSESITVSTITTVNSVSRNFLSMERCLSQTTQCKETTDDI